MYYKKVRYDSNKEMFNFIKNHFTYWTMNSWNRLKTIANNVKLYTIPDINVSDALEALDEDKYFSINKIIEAWEEDHPYFMVNFNGRSDGYLILRNENNPNTHVFKYDSCSPHHFDTYQEWRTYVTHIYGNLKDYQPTLIEYTKIVQDFDKLCDDLVEEVKYLIEKMHKREALTKSYTATLRFQRYYYDTLEDLKLHMLEMKRRNYSVYEYSEEELYAEYEMNELIESTITLDEEGDEDFI